MTAEKTMSATDFRKELMKIMPGYNWTISQIRPAGYLSATGTQSSGFNRLSTLSVIRREQEGAVRYEAKSAGFGLRAKWLHVFEGGSLASALRGLQDYYKRMSDEHRAHAEALKVGRVKRREEVADLIKDVHGIPVMKSDDILEVPK